MHIVPSSWFCSIPCELIVLYFCPIREYTERCGLFCCLHLWRAGTPTNTKSETINTRHTHTQPKPCQISRHVKTLSHSAHTRIPVAIAAAARSVALAYASAAASSPTTSAAAASATTATARIAALAIVTARSARRHFHTDAGATAASVSERIRGL